jgi:DNA polymerase-3 subunit beta
MDIIVEKSLLVKALSHMQAVVEKKSPIPVLSHVLIEGEKEGIRLSATDLDLAVREDIHAQVITQGRLTVSAHLFYEIVRKFADDKPIRLTYDEETHQVIVTSGSSIFKLSSLDPQEFPAVMTHQLPYRFLMPLSDLVKLIDKTRFAMASEEVRYYMNGLYWHPDGAYLCSAATDGHRLATTRVPLPKGAEEIPGVILSRKCVQEVMKLAQDTTTDVEVALSANQISFQFEGIYFTARLIDGVYPEYKNVIPQHHDKIIYVDMDLFSQAVDRVATVSSEKSRCVRIGLVPGKVQIAAVGNDNGFGNEEIETDYEGQSIDFVFNYRYLIDIAQQFKSSEAEIRFHDVATATVIQEPMDEDSMYLIMPMRG